MNTGQLAKMGFYLSFPVFLLTFYLLVFPATYANRGQRLRDLQQYHEYQDLSDAELHYLSSISNPKYTEEILDNILVPRVVGTPNHAKVGTYLKEQLDNLGFTVELDEFEEATPNFGVLKFRNIVGTLNPNAERYLVLACHYDSKYFKNEEFVGAIDSAVPCAMMLNLAKTLQKELSAIKDNQGLSLKLVFFDGEEAFLNWNAKDSIYGARHLAAKYEGSKTLVKSTGETVSELDKMDMLVLLDLIGHKGTLFSSYFKNTEKWYKRLFFTEKKLRSLGLIANREPYFANRANHYNYIEDDHIPFIRRDVPALHLISAPFPPEWHTPKDNRVIIDKNTVEDITKILRVFLAEYLHFKLPVYDHEDLKGNEDTDMKEEL